MADEIIQQDGQVDVPVPANVNVLTAEQATNLLEIEVPPEITVSEPIYVPTKPEEPIKTVEAPVKPTEEPAVVEAPVAELEHTIEFGENIKEVVSPTVYNYINKLYAEIEQKDNETIAVQEFNKDPYGFYAKYTPHIIVEKFNKESFVADRKSVV